MKDYENDCYKFILNLAKELAQDYGVRGSSQTFRIFPDGNILPK